MHVQDCAGGFGRPAETDRAHQESKKREEGFTGEFEDVNIRQFTFEKRKNVSSAPPDLFPNQFDNINHPTAVSPFIIIPPSNCHQMAAQDVCQRGIEDAGMAVVYYITGN